MSALFDRAFTSSSELAKYLQYVDDPEHDRHLGSWVERLTGSHATDQEVIKAIVAAAEAAKAMPRRGGPKPKALGLPAIFRTPDGSHITLAESKDLLSEELWPGQGHAFALHAHINRARGYTDFHRTFGVWRLSGPDEFPKYWRSRNFSPIAAIHRTFDGLTAEWNIRRLERGWRPIETLTEAQARRRIAAGNRSLAAELAEKNNSPKDVDELEARIRLVGHKLLEEPVGGRWFRIQRADKARPQTFSKALLLHEVQCLGRGILPVTLQPASADRCRLQPPPPWERLSVMVGYFQPSDRDRWAVVDPYTRIILSKRLLTEDEALMCIAKGHRYRKPVPLRFRRFTCPALEPYSLTPDAGPKLAELALRERFRIKRYSIEGYDLDPGLFDLTKPMYMRPDMLRIMIESSRSRSLGLERPNKPVLRANDEPLTRESPTSTRTSPDLGTPDGPQYCR